MSKEILSNLRPTLLSIPAAEVDPPTMPVEVATKEARITALHCGDDAAALTRFKIDGIAMSKEIEIAAEVTDAAEAAWDVVAVTRTEHEEEWQAIKPKAYEMRDDYIDLLEFIFENEQMDQALAVVHEIAEGTGDADMAQDLEKLHQLTVIHAEKLAEYEVTIEDIAAIGAMYQDVNILMASATVDRTRSKDELDLRNRAYTHMMKLVNKTRKAGKIAFKHDEKRRKRYRSEYRSQRNRVAYANRKAKAEVTDQ